MKIDPADRAVVPRAEHALIDHTTSRQQPRADVGASPSLQLSPPRLTEFCSILLRQRRYKIIADAEHRLQPSRFLDILHPACHAESHTPRHLSACPPQLPTADLTFSLAAGSPINNPSFYSGGSDTRSSPTPEHRLQSSRFLDILHPARHTESHTPPQLSACSPQLLAADLARSLAGGLSHYSSITQSGTGDTRSSPTPHQHLLPTVYLNYHLHIHHTKHHTNLCCVSTPRWTFTSDLAGGPAAGPHDHSARLSSSESLTSYRHHSPAPPLSSPLSPPSFLSSIHDPTAYIGHLSQPYLQRRLHRKPQQQSGQINACNGQGPRCTSTADHLTASAYSGHLCHCPHLATPIS